MNSLPKHFPTPESLVVVYNAGGPKFGHAPLGWQDFWENRAAEHEHVMLHNPGGHFAVPMRFAQLTRAIVTYPHDAWTNFKLMAKHARKRTAFKALYIGSPETLKPLEGERDRSWLSRAIDEIRPIIEARPDILFFDAFQEINEPRYQLLVERLADKYGLMLGCEPCCYDDQGGMHDWAIAVQTEFINNRAGNNGWDTGKNAKRPLRYPGKHPLVLELVRSSYLEQDIAAAQERGFVPAVNVGKMRIAK